MRVCVLGCRQGGRRQAAPELFSQAVFTVASSVRNGSADVEDQYSSPIAPMCTQRGSLVALEDVCVFFLNVCETKTRCRNTGS